MLLYFYGLIGKSLKHSFSQRYFTEKFEKENIINCSYYLFELENISDFPTFLEKNKPLKGLNVTIPYKESIIPYLDELDEKAAQIGAVNVIKVGLDGKLKGYNSDYFGFKTSLETILQNRRPKALILGTGGASKAVKIALEDLGISYQFVSRTSGKDKVSYQDVSPQDIDNHSLIINTTPLGTFPNVAERPNLPYEALGTGHILYDLVYNPALTAFLKQGEQAGAIVKNGLEMLHLQAQKAWEIWEM